MAELDLFEPGTHVFSGVVRSWNGSVGELVTDSGLMVLFSVEVPPGPAVGERITIRSRRYRPIYQATAVSKA